MCVVASQGTERNERAGSDRVTVRHFSVYALCNVHSQIFKI